MKTTVLIPFMLFAAYSATAQTSKFYEITGDVKNLPDTKLYMVTMKRTKDNGLSQPLIDSAIVTNGKFRFYKDTILLEPSWNTNIFYRDENKKSKTLNFVNKYKPGTSEYSFLLENSRMKIEGDYNDKLYLSGVPENDVIKRYGLLSPGLYKMNDIIDSLKKTKDAEKLARAIKFKNDSLLRFKNKLFSMTKENPWSWAALLNVYQNAELLTPTELEQMVQIFTKEVMATPKGLKLLNYQQQSGNLISGLKFPRFIYKDINGALIQMDKVTGKNGTLVIFWASWCGPCRAEIPELKKLYAMYKKEGINFISISTDHDIKAWKKAIKEESMPWQNVSNLPGDHEEIFRKFNVNEIPAVFLLNSKNEIVMPNEYRIAEIKDNLEKLSKAIK